MKLTKEECLELVQVVANWGTYKQYLMIKQLIEEHFDLYEKYITLECSYGDMKEYYELQITRLKKSLDNPPLKFEELKPQMWVWDNECVEYIKIHEVLKNGGEDFDGEVIEVQHDWGYYEIPFEENRFYRREVKE